MTIWERVLTALTPLGLPLEANVLIVDSESDRPDAYITYFEVTSVAVQHADNVEKHRAPTVQVTYYSRAGLATMPDIPAAMAAAGFMAAGRRELPRNQDTRHYGYALDFVFVE